LFGLGEGGNEDFVTWVEPYEFANPAGKKGTTVSVPVYDRSVEPPLFLGVAAIDMYLDAFEQVLGQSASSSNMLDRFVRLSTATCPKIELTECELDALRFLGGESEATCGRCGNNDSSFIGVIPEKCPFVSDLPNNLWDNTDDEGKSYEEKACCEIGGITASQTCSNNSTTIDLEGGSAVAVFVGLAIAGVAFISCCCFCCTKFFKANNERGSGKIVYQINSSVLGRNGSSTAPAPSMSVPTTTHVQQPNVVQQQQFQPVMAQVVQQPNVVTSVGGSYHATQPQPMYVTTQQPVVTGTVYNPNVTVMSSPTAPSMNQQVRY